MRRLPLSGQSATIAARVSFNGRTALFQRADAGSIPATRLPGYPATRKAGLQRSFPFAHSQSAYYGVIRSSNTRPLEMLATGHFQGSCVLFELFIAR